MTWLGSRETFENTQSSVKWRLSPRSTRFLIGLSSIAFCCPEVAIRRTGPRVFESLDRKFFHGLVNGNNILLTLSLVRFRDIPITQADGNRDIALFVINIHELVVTSVLTMPTKSINKLHEDRVYSNLKHKLLNADMSHVTSSQITKGETKR